MLPPPIGRGRRGEGKERARASGGKDTAGDSASPPIGRGRRGEGKERARAPGGKDTAGDSASPPPRPPPGPPPRGASLLPALRQTRSMQELGLTSIPPPPGLPPPTYRRPVISREPLPASGAMPNVAAPNVAAPTAKEPGSKYVFRSSPPEQSSPKPMVQKLIIPPPSPGTFRLPSTAWFRQKSNLESYEEELATLVKEHRLAKIGSDEELQRDLATRSLRLQKIQTKHAEGVLKLRVDHERKINHVVHEHRMHVAAQELDLQRKTHELDGRLQLDLRRIERAQMRSKWRMVIDPTTGHSYYVDDESGESRWTRPNDGNGAVLAEANVDGMEEIRDDCKCTICLDFFEGRAVQVRLCPRSYRPHRDRNARATVSSGLSFDIPVLTMGIGHCASLSPLLPFLFVPVSLFFLPLFSHVLRRALPQKNSAPMAMYFAKNVLRSI